MKRFLEELKGARKIEWLVLLAAISILMLAGFGQSDAPEAYRTEEELRLISILRRIDGAGDVDAMIARADDGIRVLVVAEGADDAGICLRLQYAARTLLGAEISRIEVIRHEKR